MSVDIIGENAQTTGRQTLAALSVSPDYGDLLQMGFVRRTSYNVGETVEFCCMGDATVIDIYRAGWYGGDGFRLQASITNTPATQPEATVIPNSNGATTCTAWTTTATWVVPTTAVSGLYLCLVQSTGAEAPNAFYISFVIRDDAAEVDLTYKTADTTWAGAYNHFGTLANPRGGRNLYGQGTNVGNILDRSFAVSHHRPLLTRDGTAAATWWMATELATISWLERNGYSMKYISSIDLDKSAAVLDTGKIFFSNGHDEYWSEDMRNNLESWRDAGENHLVFMSGNEVFWKTRYVHNATTGESIQWCYKDTMPGPTSGPNAGSHVAGQPLDPVEWTGTWRDTRWAFHRPEWFLTGTDFRMNGIHDLDVVIATTWGGHKVWGLTSLTEGDLTLGVLGFEADELRPTQPAESVRVLADYTRNIDGWRADDNGETYGGNGGLHWGVVSQRYASGAVTVGFGTCQWGWALSGIHFRGIGAGAVNREAQQFTMNLLQGLGAAPGSKQGDLTLLDGAAVPVLDDFGLVPGGLTVRAADGSILTVMSADGNALRFTIG